MGTKLRMLVLAIPVLRCSMRMNPGAGWPSCSPFLNQPIVGSGLAPKVVQFSWYSWPSRADWAEPSAAEMVGACGGTVVVAVVVVVVVGAKHFG